MTAEKCHWCANLCLETFEVSRRVVDMLGLACLRYMYYLNSNMREEQVCKSFVPERTSSLKSTYNGCRRGTFSSKTAKAVPVAIFGSALCLFYSVTCSLHRHRRQCDLVRWWKSLGSVGGSSNHEVDAEVWASLGADLRVLHVFLWRQSEHRHSCHDSKPKLAQCRSLCSSTAPRLPEATQWHSTSSRRSTHCALEEILWVCRVVWLYMLAGVTECYRNWITGSAKFF